MAGQKNHGMAGDPLQALADRLREEDTPISPHVVDPTEPSQLSEMPPDYALVVEAVREGYLLHYGQPRLLAGHDPDLALLAGDYLYALGLDRLAALGDDHAVAILANLISECARRQAEGDTEGIPDLWRTATEQIATGASTVKGNV